MPRHREHTESVSVWTLRCAKCGRCIVDCPTYLATKWEHLSPRGRIILSFHAENDSELIKSAFSCLTCAMCEVVCPSGVEVTNLLETARKRFVEIGAVPERLSEFFRKMDRSGNPYGIDVETYDPSGEVDILYYPGCTSLLREREIFESSVKILERIGVRFAIEFKYCCGSTTLRTGGSEKFARRNFERLREIVEKTGAKRIIVSCPGCYRTIARDYRKFGEIGAEVQHMVEFLAENANKLGLRKENIRIAFHDSCHLARHMKVVEEPRVVLGKIGMLVEAEQHGLSSFCCGGGGGVKLSYRDISRAVRDMRVAQLEKTGAEVVVTSCPYCYRNLKNSSGGLNIKDITIFIAERLKE
ncbi:heterodisulfide reductase-related iron-sulfur binding cluster [Geoglobus acetivorans]|uniref:(Fe-S)-binding protein n=1 Tax=Geoglobus acetivorans TaxID=565033 RepID=A0ABZ3H4B3_GEOAI|nr:(Fe-S)-binding protein [Geoglobus acetivorans]